MANQNKYRTGELVAKPGAFVRIVDFLDGWFYIQNQDGDLVWVKESELTRCTF